MTAGVMSAYTSHPGTVPSRAVPRGSEVPDSSRFITADCPLEIRPTTSHPPAIRNPGRAKRWGELWSVVIGRAVEGSEASPRIPRPATTRSPGRVHCVECGPRGEGEMFRRHPLRHDPRASRRGADLGGVFRRLCRGLDVVARPEETILRQPADQRDLARDPVDRVKREVSPREGERGVDRSEPEPWELPRRAELLVQI